MFSIVRELSVLCLLNMYMWICVVILYIRNYLKAPSGLTYKSSLCLYLKVDNNSKSFFKSNSDFLF